ncbi:MAG TPA: MFS transporter [Bryobacteraceae bacterium]|nr:MFS transporter [Bryobacteraceae bacterium]
MRSKTLGPSLAVLFLVNVLNYYDRQALGALAEPLRHEFALSDAQLGALSTVFIVVYAVAGLPLGRLADRGSRKRLLAIGVSCWAGLTGLGGLAGSYAVLAATRIGVGIGEAVCAPAAVSWISDLVPPWQRARAMAGFMMAVPIGVMLSSAITGPAAQMCGWRIALALAAAPAVLLAPALLVLQEPKRERVRAGSHGATPADLLKTQALWWIAASGAVLNFALYSFSAFLPAFLQRYHGLSTAQAGVWTGVGSGAAGILGAAAAGLCGDRIIRRWPNGRLLLAAGASLAAAPLAFAAIRMAAGSAASALALLMPAYGLLQMYYGLVYAAISDAVAPELRGTAMAAYLLVTNLGGAAFGPLLTGMLSDHLARLAAGGPVITEAARAIGLHQAIYVVPALAAALAAILWAAARAMPRTRPAAPLAAA